MFLCHIPHTFVHVQVTTMHTKINAILSILWLVVFEYTNQFERFFFDMYEQELR